MSEVACPTCGARGREVPLEGGVLRTFSCLAETMTSSHGSVRTIKACPNIGHTTTLDMCDGVSCAAARERDFLRAEIARLRGR